MADQDPKLGRVEDNYAVCSVYEDRIGDSKHPTHSDAIVFEHRNGLSYFATLTRDNEIAFRSEGYASKGARDNGLSSVMRNRDKSERYKIVEDGGKYFTCLRAGNNQEIGRSCPKASRAAAEMLIPSSGGSGGSSSSSSTLAAAATSIASGASAEAAYVPNAAREQDNYLVCSEYQERVGDSKHEKHDDVIVFQHANSLYYFATVDGNNDVALRSEGYPTTGARDNGLKSVLSNREKRTRYKIEENRGLYFTCLRAGNNQEIGRSCPKKSEAAAMALWPAMSAASLALRAREAKAKEAPAPAPAPAKKKEKAPSKSRVTENYLKCSEYEARIGDSKHPEHDDVIAFSHKNGLHYFATLDKKGGVALRSEGYQSIGARENGIKSVFKNGKLEKRYVVIRKGNTYYTALKAGNHQEIGRSCKKTSRDEANLLLPGGAALAAGLSLAASVSKPTPPPAPKAEVPAPTPPPAPKAEVPAPPPPPAPKPEAPKEREDDYLVCKEYAGRKVNDKKNNVSLFKHSNGQFYFAIVDKSGGVRLRSEGFSSSQERDKELSGALRFLEDESKYKRITKGKYHINVLYDETGREVGRSCATKESVPFVPFVAAAAVAAAVPVVAAKPKPTPPPKKKVVPVAAAAAVGTGAAAATSAAAVPPVAAAAKGGCAPWMWIAGLLLALALLYYLLPQGCNGLGCNDVKAPAVAAPKIEAPVVEKPIVAEPPPAAPEPEATPEPAPVVASCNCNSLTHPVFNVPSNREPNNITRLGRAPEFGNSHSLSPAEFFAKLQRRSANSSADRTFLNGIAKAMGYNGFSDLSADKFSSVTLERGTTGNLGSTPRHKTIYATLNTSGQDLKAFRIKAANGCDLHFMKTCGNHMFFCPKK